LLHKKESSNHPNAPPLKKKRLIKNEVSLENKIKKK